MANSSPPWGNDVNNQYNIFLKRAQEYRDARMARRAFGVLEAMTEQSMVPWTDHYDAVLWACESTNSYMSAIEVFKQMKELGVPRSVSIYIALIQLAEKRGHWREAIGD